MEVSSYFSSSSKNKENESENYYNTVKKTRQRMITKSRSSDCTIDDEKATKETVRSTRRRRRALRRKEDDTSNKNTSHSLKDKQYSSMSNRQRKSSKGISDTFHKENSVNYLENILKRIEAVDNFSSFDDHPIDSSKNPTLLLRLLQQQLKIDKNSSINLKKSSVVESDLSIVSTMVKRSLKAATSTKAASSKQIFITAHLELSWLGLQTLLSLTTHHPQELLFWESITKLFYHIIMTCCQLVATSVPSQNHEDIKTKNEDNGNHLACSYTTIYNIGIQAYQSLGEIIQTHFLSPSPSPKMIFPTPKNNNLSSSMIKIGISCSHAISTLLSSLSFSNNDFDYDTFTIQNNKNDDNIQREMMFQTISMNITIPWVRSLLSLSSNSKEEDQKYKQEATTHAKRIHKLLWDKATVLSARETRSDYNEDVILCLRRDALLALYLHYHVAEEDGSVLSCNTNQRPTYLEVSPSSPFQLPLTYIKRNWNQINTLAWKSASMYFSSSKSKNIDVKSNVDGFNQENRCLQKFHIMVGNMLDEICSSYFSLSNNNIIIEDNNDDDMMAYVEYCAIRAFHIGKSINGHCFRCSEPSCLFTKLPYIFVHTKHVKSLSNSQNYCEQITRNNADKATTICGLFFTVLHLQNLLNQASFHNFNQTHREPDQGQQFALKRMVKTIIHRFVETFIVVDVSANSQTSVVTTTDIGRCYKLFSLLKISNFLNCHIQRKMSSKKHPHEDLLLYLLGRIFMECFIPLYHKLADENKTNDNKFRPIAIEGLLRAAALFDFVANRQEFDLREISNPQVESNSCIYELFTFFYHCKPSTERRLDSNSMIEMAGKSLANIGKRRKDEIAMTPFSCIIPLVLSVDLLSKLASSSTRTNNNGDNSKDNQNAFGLKSYQLSLRYSHLSTIFQSFNMWKEAVVSLGLALRFLIVEYSTVDCKDSNIKKISITEKEIDYNHGYEMNIADMLIICSNHSEKMVQQVGFYSTNHDDANPSHFLSIIHQLIETYSHYIHDHCSEAVKLGDKEDSENDFIDIEKYLKFYAELKTETFLGGLLEECNEENENSILSLPHLIRKTLLQDEHQFSIQTSNLDSGNNNSLFNKKMGIVHRILHDLSQASLKSTTSVLMKKIIMGDIDKITQFALSYVDKINSKEQEIIGKCSRKNDDRTGNKNQMTCGLYFYDQVSAICISAASNFITSEQKKFMEVSNDGEFKSNFTSCFPKLIQMAQGKLQCGHKSKIESTTAKLKYLIYDITLSMMVTKEYSELNPDNNPKIINNELKEEETTISKLFCEVSVSSYESILFECAKAVEMVSSLNSEIHVQNELILGLIVTVTEIYHLMSFKGAAIFAAQALKILSALRNVSDSNDYCDGLLFGSTLLEGELYECASNLLEQNRHLSIAPKNKLTGIMIAKKLIDNVIEIKDSKQTMQTRKQVEKINIFTYRVLFHCHEINLIVNFCSGLETQTTMDEIRLICELQQETLPEFFDNFERIMHHNEIIFILCIQWWVSTCLLALSALQEKSGQLQNSLQSVRLCCLIVKRTLNFSIQNSRRKNSEKLSTSESTMYLDSTAFNRAFLVRVSTCLDRMSFLYSTLGDHRKANGYILSSASILGVISQNIKIPKKRFFDEVMMLEDVNIQSLRHLRCLRGILHIHSLSVPFSLPSDESYLTLEFNFDKFKKIISSHSSGDETASLGKTDWIREIIHNFIMLGDMSKDFRISKNSEFPLTYNYEVHVADKYDLTQALCNLFSEEGSWDKMKYAVPTRFLHNYSWYNDSFSYQKHTFGPTVCEIKLRTAKLKYRSFSDEEKNRGIDLFTDVAGSQYASVSCRADSYYHLGLYALQKARENGGLHSLWQNHSIFLNQQMKNSRENDQGPGLSNLCADILSARDHFKNAANILGPSSSQLSRKVMRCLALVTGPTKYSESIGLSAAVLVHNSIGSTARQFLSRCDDSDNVIFSAFDEPISSHHARDKAIRQMFDIGSRLIPVGWNFIAMALCPTGELLIASLATTNESNDKKGIEDKILCVFPETINEFGLGETQVHKEIVNALDSLIESSKQQLSGMDFSAKSAKYNEEGAKRQWWRERKQFDESLQNLVEFVQRTYFENSLMHDLFSVNKLDTTYANGDSSDDGDSSDESYFVGGNLAAKFEAALHIDEKTSSVSEIDFSQQKQYLQKKTVVEIKKELKSIGLLPKEFRGLKKAELIDLLITRNMKSEQTNNCLSLLDSEQEDASISSDKKLTEKRSKCEDKCTFLILDENLHRFPWESMDFLSTSTVCRIPSLSFAIATLMKSDFQSNQSLPELNPFGASFVLDPESNLSNTQKKILPVLQEFSKKNKWEWKGVTGTLPTTDFMTSALKRDRGLFLYCGHGGGERFFSRHQIENLFKNDTSFERKSLYNKTSPQSYRCNSSIVLMGCSSGKLSSVNSPKTFDAMIDTNYHYEPEGMALSYLCSGAPCVVSNLWDVTDRDIDRYFVRLLQTFLNEESELVHPKKYSLAACVAKSRSACKMRYIVGCAPVVYGIPVTCRFN